MTVCTIGLGYIGLPTSALLANNNIRVHGVDNNKTIIETLRGGGIHIVENGLNEIVQNSLASGVLTVSNKVEKSDVYLIVVPTPFRGNNEPDISYVETAAESVIALLKKGDLFIIESTCPVGTTEKIAKRVYAKRPDLKDEIFVAYCPERVLPGNVMYELIHNDRVIGGLDDASTAKAHEFYSKVVRGELHKTNARTAEMCKLTENASRDAQIAFANELSLICDKADIDVWELIKLANRHPRVNILQPGCGVGGHCIAVDPWFIVSDYPLESRMITASREINNHKSFWCAEKINDAIKGFELKRGIAPKVALMGLAFKPNIDDLRESPAKYIAMKVLQHDHNGEIFIVEPNIKEHHVFKITECQEAYDKADIVAFLVAHDEFSNIKMKESKLILDFCGVTK